MNYNILFVGFSINEYTVSFPIFSDKFWAEAYFVRYQNSYACLLAGSIYLKYLFPTFNPKMMPVLGSNVCFLDKGERWILFFLIHYFNLTPFGGIGTIHIENC